jgi:hypothetical protein
MSGKWIEIVELRFDGERFSGHALPLDALNELIEYQGIITKTAIELFKKKHPERERISRNFEQSTVLRFTHIGEGSAAIPLEAYFEDDVQLNAFEKEPIVEAVELTGKTVASIQNNKALPDDLPRNVIPLFGRFGSTLKDNERIHIHPRHAKAVEYNSAVRACILEYAEKGYEDTVDVIGMVGAADVVNRTFHLYQAENIKFPVVFPPEAEEVVTTALKEHRFKKLAIKGWGEYAADGTLKKIVRLDELEEVGQELIVQDNAGSIVDELLSLVADVPDEELRKLPKDFSSNHDKYLYNR